MLDGKKNVVADVDDRDKPTIHKLYQVLLALLIEHHRLDFYDRHTKSSQVVKDLLLILRDRGFSVSDVSLSKYINAAKVWVAENDLVDKIPKKVIDGKIPL